MYLQFCVFPFVLIFITLSMKSMQSFLCEKEFEKNDWFCEVQFSIIKQRRKTLIKGSQLQVCTYWYILSMYHIIELFQSTLDFKVKRNNVFFLVLSTRLIKKKTNGNTHEIIGLISFFIDFIFFFLYFRARTSDSTVHL